MPAVAHRREIPYNRNGTPRTRASQMPAVAHRREIPRERNGTPRTRAVPLARGGSPPSVVVTNVPSPRSQHSCFAALAKNSHLWTVFTALRAAASRRSIPTVVSLPRNDKLKWRAQRFKRFGIKTKRTPVPPCHCERRRSRSVAISRKGNVGNVPAPARLPAPAHRHAPARLPAPAHRRLSVSPISFIYSSKRYFRIGIGGAQSKKRSRGGET